MKWGKKQHSVSVRCCSYRNLQNSSSSPCCPSLVEPESLVGLPTIYRIPKITRTTGGFLSDARTVKGKETFRRITRTMLRNSKHNMIVRTT